jgi:hypothetical protein
MRIVRLLVHVEMGLLHECLVASVAREISGSCVALLVLEQASFNNKQFLTNVTDVLCVVGVNCSIVQEQIFLAEPFRANVASKFHPVPVHREVFS